MLVGTADLATLAAGAPRMPGLAAGPLELHGVEIFQLATEIAAANVERLYPPALHPTLPPLAVFRVLRCADGPLGAFALAELRLSCRSGLRPRAFLVTGFTDSDRAARALGEGFGYRLRSGEVELRRLYDEVVATVSVGGRTILDLHLRSPDPLSPSDAQNTVGMHLAETPRGLRLVQVEPELTIERVERGRPLVRTFAADAWGDGIRPTFPVSATIALGDLKLPSIRFLCRPDVWAFEGTERVE